MPMRVLRLFRHGRGQCENRWMDEHIKVAEVRRYMRENDVDVVTAIDRVLGVKVG